MVRLSVYLRRLRRRPSGWEPVLLALDFVAVVSFLPLEWVVRDQAYLRLFRLTRLVLLLGYWGGMVRDLWLILTGRERRSQVVFLGLLGILLSLGGAVVVAHFAPSYDFNDDGVLDARDRSFLHVLWWSFRQVQDPGNLTAEPAELAVVSVSLVLTFSGLVLFSFLIGLATGAMDELMERARDRPVGLRDHTVILGLDEYSHFLISELEEIYRKNLRRLRAAVLSPGRKPPEYLRQARFRGFQYRTGDPVKSRDLDKLDLARARRVMILGTHPQDPDAEVISAILATRDRNPRVDLYPNLEHEKNFLAARAAGGGSTHVVGSGSFLGYYLAQNVFYPGVYRIYRQLLTSVGSEIYTYLFDPGERARLCAAAAGDGVLDPAALYFRGLGRHGVTVVGCFAAPEGSGDLEIEDLAVILNPMWAAWRSRVPYAFDGAGRIRCRTLRGLVGIALRWEDLRGFALGVAADPGGGGEVADPGGLPPLDLRLPAGRARRILICGGSLRVPRLVREMVEFYGGVEVTILVPSAERLDSLARDVHGALEGFLSQVPSPSAPRAALSRRDGRLEVRVAAAGGEARVRLLQRDWTDLGRLLRSPEFDLLRTDVLLFLPGMEGAEDPDGATALGMLRVADFEARGGLRFAPGFRVLGAVRDPVRGDLLESRLDHGGDPCRFTVVSGERLRHQFIVQNMFVRGLNAVYLELLGASGQHLARLLPAWSEPPAGTFDPWDLARHLLLERGLCFVGLELLGAGGSPQVVLDLRELGPARLVPWSSLAAVYALGEGHELLKA